MFYQDHLCFDISSPGTICDNINGPGGLFMSNINGPPGPLMPGPFMS